jgi:hypothetical protein
VRRRRRYYPRRKFGAVHALWGVAVLIAVALIVAHFA